MEGIANFHVLKLHEALSSDHSIEDPPNSSPCNRLTVDHL